MSAKQCPKCKRYSVSFDFSRGAEICHWRDCGWVNSGLADLPVAHATVVTSCRRKSDVRGLSEGQTQPIQR